MLEIINQKSRRWLCFCFLVVLSLQRIKGQYVVQSNCPGWICPNTSPYCMQGCYDICGCCIPCPFLGPGEYCLQTLSSVGTVTQGLCGPGLLCEPFYGVCASAGPFYKPLPYPIYYPNYPFSQFGRMSYENQK